MKDSEQVIREFYEAEVAYRRALAEALSGDEMVALPQDVREARASLKIKSESERLANARCDFEILKADREERWVASHEDMYGIRRGVTS